MLDYGSKLYRSEVGCDSRAFGCLERLRDENNAPAHPDLASPMFAISPRSLRSLKLVRPVSIALAVLAASVLASCQSLMQPQDAAAVVKQRAEARWTALMAGDFRKAYTFMAPSFRAVVDADRFSKQFGGGGVSWEKAQVVDVKCSDDQCKTVLKISYRPLLGGRKGDPFFTHFDETWIREDGQWWMFQKV